MAELLTLSLRESSATLWSKLISTVCTCNLVLLVTTPELKALLNEKKRAFRCGNREKLRRVQRDLKYKIWSRNESFRRKMEVHL